MSLCDLRDQLGALDRELIELVAKRQQLAAAIGREKRRVGVPVRDFQQERDVLERARRIAAESGVSPTIAEELMLCLIRASLTAQEQQDVQRSGGGSGKRALVIGGAGRLGSWFARFLAAQGFDVEVADPAGPLEGFAHRADWNAGAVDHDLVVVAAPLGATDGVLLELAGRRPTGVVFDVGSIKRPLAAGHRALRDAGVRTTSIHPMFGPDTDLLSGRHVILVDLGDDDANAVARELFGSTMATMLTMDVERHDELIAFVLGLSHATNIAFFTALAESGEASTQLADMSSSTFDAQLAVAQRVAAESPELYFEIQARNEFAPGALDALARSVDKIRSCVRDDDADAFRRLMEAGHAYLSRRVARG
ncbi:MAG: bifunctional chorismate mutase/prephenate dehydrogenase [Planctomycetes bacterium]|nr:bifunctional chorismate mutase/prephenate dehydrogenase [Planctomycetota bacterium]